MIRLLAVQRALSFSAAASLAAGLGWGQGARAQDVPDPVFAQQHDLVMREPDRFVTEREDDTAAQGVRIGAFMLRPALELAGLADSNVRVRSNARSDVALAATPKLGLDIQNGGLTVTSFVRASIARYARFDTENVEQMAVGGKLERSFGSAVRLIVQGEAGTYVEDRTAVFAASQSLTPVEYDRNYGSAALVVALGKLIVIPSFEADRIGYKDNRFAVSPDTLLPQGSRSFLRLEPSLLVGWWLSPATALYAGGSYNDRTYDYRIPFDRDSIGYRLFGGLRFQPSPLTRLNVAVGYMRQNYSGALSDPKGIYARAIFDWTPSRLVLVSAGVERDISESGNLLLGGSVRTRVHGAVTYELRRAITLTGRLEWRKFDLTQIDAESRRTVGAMGMEYRITRHVELFANGEVIVSRGDAQATPEKFERYRLWLGTRFRL